MSDHQISVPGRLPFPTQEVPQEQEAAAWCGFDSQVNVSLARKQMATVASRWRQARQLPHGRQLFGGGSGRVQQEWGAAGVEEVKRSRKHERLLGGGGAGGGTPASVATSLCWGRGGGGVR